MWSARHSMLIGPVKVRVPNGVVLRYIAAALCALVLIRCESLCFQFVPWHPGVEFKCEARVFADSSVGGVDDQSVFIGKYVCSALQVALTTTLSCVSGTAIGGSCMHRLSEHSRRSDARLGTSATSCSAAAAWPRDSRGICALT
jgi:hypothetical protein